MTRRLIAAVALLWMTALPAPVAAQPANPAAASGWPAAEPASAVAQPASAAAQRPEPIGEDQDLNRPMSRIFQDIGGDLLHTFTGQSLAWMGAGGFAAAALAPLDDELTVPPGEEWNQWSEIFDPGTYIGNFAFLLGASATTYGVGTWKDRPRVAHVGRDLMRTQVTSQLIVQGLKVAISRDRPDESADNSFPSGHAASTFASAVVFQRHMGRKWAFLTYGVATYVAVARMHENKHHLSDVVMGAGIGIASGYSTTRHATSTWAVNPVATPGGAAVMVSRIY